MSDILIDNKHIYAIEYNFLTIFSWLTKITVFLFIIGFFNQKPEFFVKFNFVVKVFLALFLMYRFNSYRKNKVQFTDLDRKICYSSGIYILIISFFDLYNQYIEKLRKVINPYTVPIVDKIKKTFSIKV